jgi:hypothetical protein
MGLRWNGAHACGAAFVVGCLLFSAPRLAGADETAVRNYYAAIEAAEQCDHRSFSQADHEKMAAVINENGGSDLPFNQRMALISQSRNDAKDVIQKYGCKSDKVGAMLQIFHTQLEPAL